MRYIIVGLLLLLLCLVTSCSSEFYCKHCPKETVDTIIHVENDSLGRRDTIIYLKGDTIFSRDSIDCPDYINEFGNTKTKVKVVIKNKIITVEVINGPVQVKADLYDHYKRIYDSHYHSEVKEVFKDRKRTWWSWLGYYQSWLCIGLFSLYGFLKYLKIRYKVPIPFI